MWLLFHRKSGTKVVAGGKTFTDECPTCEHTTRFKEVEVGESYGVWFVDVVSDAERAFRCESCGDVFDLRDQPATETDRKQLEAAKVEALAAEQRRRDALKASNAVKRDNRIDDELAELKKRMGR